MESLGNEHNIYNNRKKKSNNHIGFERVDKWYSLKLEAVKEEEKIRNILWDSLVQTEYVI